MWGRFVNRLQLRIATSEARGVLRYIFTKPLPLGALVVCIAVFSLAICGSELQMKHADPYGWSMMYGHTGGTTAVRCVFSGAMGFIVGFVPLFAGLFIYQLRRTWRNE